MASGKKPTNRKPLGWTQYSLFHSRATAAASRIQSFLLELLFLVPRDRLDPFTSPPSPTRPAKGRTSLSQTSLKPAGTARLLSPLAGRSTSQPLPYSAYGRMNKSVMLGCQLQQGWTYRAPGETQGAIPQKWGCGHGCFRKNQGETPQNGHYLIFWAKHCPHMPVQFVAS